MCVIVVYDLRFWTGVVLWCLLNASCRIVRLFLKVKHIIVINNDYILVDKNIH